jgi:hypothetical protein
MALVNIAHIEEENISLFALLTRDYDAVAMLERNSQEGSAS